MNLAAAKQWRPERRDDKLEGTYQGVMIDRAYGKHKPRCYFRRSDGQIFYVSSDSLDPPMAYVQHKQRSLSWLKPGAFCRIVFDGMKKSPNHGGEYPILRAHVQEPAPRFSSEIELKESLLHA